MKQKHTRGVDRRKNPATSGNEIPLIDRNGPLIVEDRRIVQDRRLNNISLEEMECKDYIQAIVEKEKE